MEYELLYGKRRNKTKNQQLLYLPTEKCLFVKNNERNGKKEFQCYQRVLFAQKSKNGNNQAHLNCLARATIDENGILRRNDTPHTEHVNHELIVNDLRIANTIKDICATAGNGLPTHKVSTKQIFYTEIARNGMISNLSYDQMKRQLFRIKNAKYPKLPKIIKDIQNAFRDEDVMKEYGHTLDQSHTLYVGTVIENAFSFIAFASYKIINSIADTIPPAERHFLIDGTFNMVPRQFYQLVVVSIEYKNDIFPVFYVLMTRKTANSYKSVFNYLETIFPLQPKEIISDFETGLRKAINEVYPTATLRGCWYHFCSAIHKKCAELGMRRLIASNPEAKFFQRQLMDIPLLPPADIIIGFKGVRDAIKASPFAESFIELLRYFEGYCLKQNAANSISVAGLKMRTTSSLESLNSQMSRTFPTHGHIWQFIEQLKFHEFAKSSEFISKIRRDNVSTPIDQPKTKKAQERHKKIQFFSSLLKDGNISAIDFLEAMAGKIILPMKGGTYRRDKPTPNAASKKIPLNRKSITITKSKSKPQK